MPLQRFAVHCDLVVGAWGWRPPRSGVVARAQLCRDHPSDLGVQAVDQEGDAGADAVPPSQGMVGPRNLGDAFASAKPIRSLAAKHPNPPQSPLLFTPVPTCHSGCSNNSSSSTICITATVASPGGRRVSDAQGGLHDTEAPVRELERGGGGRARERERESERASERERERERGQ